MTRRAEPEHAASPRLPRREARRQHVGVDLEPVPGVGRGDEISLMMDSCRCLLSRPLTSHRRQVIQVAAAVGWRHAPFCPTCDQLVRRTSNTAAPRTGGRFHPLTNHIRRGVKNVHLQSLVIPN